MSRDYFNNETGDLLNKKLWLFDMDGTIYKDDCLFDGTIELLNFIKKSNGKYVFITNNSSKSIDDYILKTKKLGIESSIDDFFTSSQATILYIKEKFPNVKVYCQGTKSLINELYNSGIDVVTEICEDIGLVLVGFDTELTSEKLRKTCFLLSKNIPFIATNCDLRCPVEFGFIPDCGSICQMITNATEKKPKYIGKPEPIMVEFAMQKYGFNKNETVVIGDRLYTDIASGVNANVDSVCVLTGEATIKDILESEIKPLFVFNSIKDILN